jgi:hypothetical protein
MRVCHSDIPVGGRHDYDPGITAAMAQQAPAIINALAIVQHALAIGEHPNTNMHKNIKTTTKTI